MEEIKVGEYCRTSAGKIFKCSEIVLGNIPKDENKTMIVQYIVKHSSNLIDLIEVGDILKLKNGEKWEVQEHQGNGNWLQLEWENIDDNEDFLKKVDSIITKEQFKENSYKVGD